MWLLLKMVWIWKTTKAFDVLHIYPSAKELGEQSVLLCECVCICNNTHETSCALPVWNKLHPALMYPCHVSSTGVCVWTGGAGRGRNGIHREEIGAGLGGEDKREINGEEEINWCVEIRHPPPPPKKNKEKKIWDREGKGNSNKKAPKTQMKTQASMKKETTKEGE